MQSIRKLLTLFTLSAVLAMTACAGSSTKESAGEFVDDSAITTKVKASIFDDPYLKSLDINVVTFKGEVQLSGFVGSIAENNRAVAIAKGVNGVTSVKNDMKVKGGANSLYK